MAKTSHLITKTATAQVWACLCVAALTLVGCQRGPDEELTSTKPHADLIGARYRVVSTVLHAYGVYASLNEKKSISMVDVIPFPIGGPEVAFDRVVARGQIVKILSAWRHHSIVRTRVYYLVALEGLDLPEGVPIRLELSRGNEGVGAELNPAIYEKLPRTDQ
jgi:hypothetical protein